MNSKKELKNELILKKAENMALQGKYNNLKGKYNRLKEHSDDLEKYCNSLSGHCNCCKFKLANNYQNYSKQIEDKIASLIKERDNYKSDYEYAEKCFQAERETRYKLEDEIKVLKGEKKYPCISLECNDITGESSSLYFCFSYDEKVLLANNVPKLIFKSYFQIHASVDRLGLTYHITCPPVLNPKTDKPYVYFKILHDTKQLIDYDRPLDWMNYKKDKNLEISRFEPYISINDKGINLQISQIKNIHLDIADRILKCRDNKIWYDPDTGDGLVQIYSFDSKIATTYYIKNNKMVYKHVVDGLSSKEN